MAHVYAAPFIATALFLLTGRNSGVGTVTFAGLAHVGALPIVSPLGAGRLLCPPPLGAGRLRVTDGAASLGPA